MLDVFFFGTVNNRDKCILFETCEPRNKKAYRVQNVKGKALDALCVFPENFRAYFSNLTHILIHTQPTLTIGTLFVTLNIVRILKREPKLLFELPELQT